MRALYLFLSLVIGVCSAQIQLKPWQYKCDEHKRCVRTGLKESDADLGMAECQLTCDEYALLWPKPKSAQLGKTVSTVSVSKIDLVNDNSGDVPVIKMLQRNIDDQITWMKLKSNGQSPNSSENELRITYLGGDDNSVEPKICRESKEGYTLSIAKEGSVITANITATEYFGARHGIEALFQLIEFDEVKNAFIILDDVEIEDQPEFSHRGISLDTSRNFISVKVIKRIIDGMSASKLNVFHWHIVDTHSFPVELKTSPIDQMTQYGAYNARSIYTQDQIKDIVEYANYRGVQVIPELDQPAHVGHGWNFPGAENYTVCLNAEPWYDYCVEPPCGQLNPGEAEIYNVLEKLYTEFYDMFQFTSFHMGADEVNFACWNSSQLVLDYMANIGLDRKEEDFIQLWREFQEKSSAKLKDVYETKKGESETSLRIIVWTSHITLPEYIDNLDPDTYTIQIWTKGSDLSDPTISSLLDKGYDVIFSNYENTYLDCGFGAWVGEGNNWCSPYIGWQKLYDNDIYKLVERRGFQLTDKIKSQILGGETNMWSEQVDDTLVEGKIFPRSDAFAERLWSNPSTTWYEAETRMLNHRHRLVQRGIRADALQTEWCRLNEGQCYGNTDTPNFENAPSETTTETLEASST